MRKIFRFYVDCGRNGEIEGVFTADQTEVDQIMGETIFLDEVLGKHSHVEVEITDEITVISDDEDFVSKFEEIMGSGSISGINPLSYQ